VVRVTGLAAVGLTVLSLLLAAGAGARPASRPRARLIRSVACHGRVGRERAVGQIPAPPESLDRSVGTR
jgi:hypothetical protein